MSLNAPHFRDEAAAFAKLENILWPDGPVCPHCGGKERIYAIKDVRTKASQKHPKGVVRPGLKKCGHCRKQFTVRLGTVFESSHIPLHKWLQGVFLLCSSKKGLSSHHLHRVLEITYEAAWFMSHRIREAMRSGALAPMGGGGGIVELDETFLWNRAEFKHTPGHKGLAYKMTVLTLVDRKGEARSFHISRDSNEDAIPIARADISKKAALATDAAGNYTGIENEVAQHEMVVHSDFEWARGDIKTNTVEGFFSVFKRGMRVVGGGSPPGLSTAR
jgi:transposase-like protein